VALACPQPKLQRALKEKLLVVFIPLLIYACGSVNKSVTRTVRWKDFKGVPDTSSTFDASIFWSVSYEYDTLTTETGALKVDLKVWCTVDEESWVKRGKKSYDLLKHEQGHFNIGRLCANEFKETVANFRFKKHNYELCVDSIFYETFRKYRELDDQYDLETDHSVNVEQQLQWDRMLRRRLRK
jgi:hypothetical protein